MPPTIRITNNTVQGQVKEDKEGEELTAKELLAAQQATFFLEKLEATSNLDAPLPGPQAIQYRSHFGPL
jgi:hypothetical protein